MNIKYDKILGKLREDTDGVDGSLRDSTNTIIATVSRGLITQVFFTGTFDLWLAQNGVDNFLLQNGTDRIGLQ